MSPKAEPDNPDSSAPKRDPLTPQDTLDAAKEAHRQVIEELSGELAEKDSLIHALEEDNASLVQKNREMIAKCHEVAEENKQLKAEIERMRTEGWRIREVGDGA